MMNKYFKFFRSIIYIVIVASILVLVSCRSIFTAKLTPAVASTPTQEKLRVIDGELDACQLITLAEFESVLGVKVSSEKLLDYDSPGCKYVSVAEGRVLLQIYTSTNTTIKKPNSTEFYSAADLYAMHKKSSLNFPKITTVVDIKNFGDKAFLTKDVFLALLALKNDVFYEFVTRIDGGISYEHLMKLARIALQRMP